LVDSSGFTAQKGNSSLVVGNAFLRFEAVRPQGNSIGETPAAFALRAHLVLRIL
jgi:hypothetical protein